ncbi:MAG: transporter substrate-binding domain-containing protein [Kordiimonadaceae bacterium]|nr:transporter substrate-binding domain-containing protein [Kordiimonadaceae bacterium]MBT6035404.1 transporter substrate-binding domain-containing protein [Kordiimonadaceae bacterium]MBT6330682.1 transporter substrate-binding domain-containing protein [Kordiimonadaceae bacterium]MBT7583495.1 transporter substrate-binding domain-containing protein [Kordiimonadaceae bacterium]
MIAFFSTSLAQTNDQPLNSIEFILSAEEQLWVAEHPVVRITNQMDWAPFDFIQGGNPTGFSIDYINLILQKVGLTGDYINGYTWEELHKQTEDKEIDIIHSLIQTEERDKLFLFTSPYLDMSLGYYAKTDSLRIFGPSDFAGKSIGAIAGSGTKFAFQQKYPNAELVDYDDVLEALIALSSGNIDIYIGRIPVVNYTINKNFMADLELVCDVELSATTQVNNIRLATRNDWPELRTILEKGMASISDDEYNLLVNKWQARSSNELNFILTDEEKAWLEENNIIRVSATPNISPLEFVTVDENISGITGSYLDRISDILDVRFIWAKNKSWTEGFEMIKSGQADIISAATSTPERNRYLEFTDSYLTSTNMIFTKRENATYSTMENLAGKKIAQVEGFAVTTFIKQDYPEINLIEVASIKDALSLVDQNEVDAFIGSVMVATPTLSELGIDNIVAVGETPYRIEETIGIRSNLPLLASAINKALNSISAVERTAINRSWMSLKVEPKQDYQLVFTIASILILVITVILFWNASLRREVNSRIKIEQKLMKSQEIAENANTAKSAFLANMSHEIRTPLNAIIGFSNAMTSEIYGEINPPKYKEYLSDITNSGLHLATVIDDILDLSKIEAGKLQLVETEFDLNECTIEAIRMIRSDANDKNIELTYQEEDALVYGDKNAIKRVIINLLSNAVKYTNIGGEVLDRAFGTNQGGSPRIGNE